jgi:hypothetical protein
LNTIATTTTQRQVSVYLGTVYFIDHYLFKNDGKSIWFQLNSEFKRVDRESLSLPQHLTAMLEQNLGVKSEVTQVDITIDVEGTFWCKDTETKGIFKTCLKDLFNEDQTGLFKELYRTNTFKVRQGENCINTCLKFEILKK